MLLLDATRGLEAQDLRIADQVIEEGRALIIALNKWDVAENASRRCSTASSAALDEGLAQVKGVPLLTVSAATGKGLDVLLDGRLRHARGLVAARRDRRAQPLVRARARSATRRRRRAASGSSCATSPRPRPGRRASSCSAPAPTSCRRAIAAIWSTACARARLRRGAGAAHAARAEEPVRPMSWIEVDARGLRCPWPALRLARALRRARGASACAPTIRPRRGRSPRWPRNAAGGSRRDGRKIFASGADDRNAVFTGPV